MEIYSFLFILENSRTLRFMMKKNAYAKKNEPGSNKKTPNICTIIIYLHQLSIFSLFPKKPECVHSATDIMFVQTN